MLGVWRSHKEYQGFVFSELKSLIQVLPTALYEYRDAISKLLILNLDTLQDVIASLYSSTGRPAEVQPEIFRSLILMNHIDIPLDKWTQKLKDNVVLRTIAGFTEDNSVETASYYDFINRIVKLDDKPAMARVSIKPKTKLKAGEKLPPKNPGIVASLVDKLISDEKAFLDRLNGRQERFLQKIFASVCVQQSIDCGIVPTTVSISGDGTCIETAANPNGVKVCDCKSKGIYQCDCNRRFSDPFARWGRDSSKNQFFYGHMAYFMSIHNKEQKLDLPLYLRFFDANRHDSISAVFALAEFRELYPNLTVETFISDSASDNNATYKLLNHFGSNAVIALNERAKGNLKYADCSVNRDGVPICRAGYKMIFNGHCKGRCRTKWRCPCVLGKAPRCEACDECSPSKYGRVVYTKPDWDLRRFTEIPRGSRAWKAKMKERTAAERINNRILNDYGIEQSKTRGRKRLSFFVTIAAFNIHLDAQLKKLTTDGKFNFDKLFFADNNLLIA